MLPTELITKARKIIELTKDKSLVNNTYFNPIFADRLAEKVPELKDTGFNFSKTETESGKGTVISAKVVAPNGEELDLGTLLLDGKNVIVQRTLTLPDTLLNFIEEALPQEF